MLTELVLGLALALGLAWFVMGPVLRPGRFGAGRPGDNGGDEASDDAEDLSPRAVALRALKEIEFDRATGKLSEADYADLKGRYTTAALAAMREASDAVPSPRPSAPPSPVAMCPDHGARPEAEAVFCSVCGRRLAVASGVCAGCGSPLESGANYCNACGVRVAA